MKSAVVERESHIEAKEQGEEYIKNRIPVSQA